LSFIRFATPVEVVQAMLLVLSGASTKQTAVDVWIASNQFCPVFFRCVVLTRTLLFPPSYVATIALVSKPKWGIALVVSVVLLPLLLLLLLLLLFKFSSSITSGGTSDNGDADVDGDGDEDDDGDNNDK
jgi:hypothetical protein